jgi:16S rRNA C967 or C1407 C5-methylase (RsmB/RsmF family)
LTAKQAAILQSAARLVKSGGRLVYATCSVLPEENEAIAEAFGAANPEFEPQDAVDLLNGLKVAGAEGLGRRRGRRQALSASLAAPSCYRWLLCRGLEPEVGRKTQRRQITRDGSRI